MAESSNKAETTSEVGRAIDALNAAHSFPGSFTFKAIGSNTEDFAAAVLQAAKTVLGSDAQPALTTRQSAQGRHQAVHLSAQVASAEQVVAIYAALRGLAGLAMLL